MPILFQNERVSYNDNHFMNLVETALSYGGREITVANGVIENISGKVNVNPWIVAAKIIGTVAFPIFVLIAYLIRESYRARLTIESDNAKMQRAIQDDLKWYHVELLDRKFFDDVSNRWITPYIVKKPFDIYLTLCTNICNNSGNKNILEWKSFILHLEHMKIRLPLYYNHTLSLCKKWGHFNSHVQGRVDQIFNKIEEEFESLIHLINTKISLLPLSPFIDDQLRLLEINKNLDILLNPSTTNNHEAIKEAWLYIHGYGTCSQKELAFDLYRATLSPEGQNDLDIAISRHIPEATPLE